MHRVWLAVLIATMVGCEEIDSSGDVFTPRVVAGGSSAPPAADVAFDTDGGFDFDAEDRDAEPTDEQAAADLDKVLREYGLGQDSTPAVAEAAPVVAAVPADIPVALPSAPVAAPWQPGVPVGGSWGAHLISTTATAQPPIAVLGLSDGSTLTVQPGDLLPEPGIIVLAVGHNAIHIAEVIPTGDRARVETRTLTALHPSTPAALAGP